MLHYANYTTLHYTNHNYSYSYNYTPLHYTTIHQLHYTRLHYSTQHYSTLHYTTLHYTTLITPHYKLQLQLHYTNYTTLQLQLHYTTTYYNYKYSCTTPHYIQQLWVRWPLQPLQPLQKTQIQPPFGPSVDSLSHPCVTTTKTSPKKCPIFEISTTALCGTGNIYTSGIMWSSVGQSLWSGA